MARSFLAYWRRDQIQAAVASGLLTHAASEQFGHVVSGDTLWITGRSADKSLVTVGPLRIAEIVSQKVAEQRLSNPWKAKYHAFCAAGAETTTCEVSLTPILSELEFVSRRSPKLNLERPLGCQLQALRHLTAESAKQLETLWNHATKTAMDEYELIQRELDSYGELDQERTVVTRREQAFLRRFLFRGDGMGTCAICGETIPVALLVAAHIKPRADCDDSERRDYANNVIPMCALGCDALFERGYLVIDEAKVQVRASRSSSGKLYGRLKRLAGRPVLGWTESRAKYFSWHAANLRNLNPRT